MMKILLATVWAGCASKPSVSQDMLADVPPAVVEQVRTMRADEQRLAEEIATAEGELTTARQRESNQQARLNAQNDALKNERRLKRLAVERADPDAAQTADDQVAEREATVRRIEEEYQQSSLDRRRLEASLGVMRAERELTKAQIELAQARSLDGGDREMRLDRFERAVVDAQGDLDAAKREQAYVDAEPTPRPLQNPARPASPQEPEPAPEQEPAPEPEEDPGPQPLPPPGDTGTPPI
jgi:chromosome segregation ATPase